MNHQEFLTKWVGKRYRETPQLGYQCTSLCKLYNDEVNGIKWLYFWWSAINWWNLKWNLQVFFNKVEFAQQGDMVFFNITPSNPYGHVAIVDSQSVILEQNGWQWWNSGLWPDAIRIHSAPPNVLGYMRLKSTVEDRVAKFVEKYGLKTPSKSQPYSQYDTCIILSLMDQ